MREELARVFAAAVAACDPARATARALAGDDVRRLLGKRVVHVAAVGKAARAMAAGAARALGGRVVGGVVVVPEGAPAVPLPAALEVREAAHPVPDARSEAAGRALLQLAGRVPPDAALLALVSGGASALAAVPAPGLTLEEKIAKVGEVVRAGAPIAEINRVRASLSAIKGGRLAAACRAPVVTVAVSDVVGDDLAVIGSGPTIPPRPGDHAILASGLGTLAEAARAALGEDATIVDAGVTGDVDALAARIVEAIRTRAGALVWTGEPTIAVGPSPGRGGRARHVALVVARALAGVPGWTLLAAGSDGIDGTPDAAGAIVDGDTWAAIADGEGALARHDAGTALAPFALVTGPTGVNHADLYVAVTAPRR